MKQGKLLVALVALPVAFAGCDIFAPDSLDPPGIRLTGFVVDASGEPVPVRTPGSNQLRLWHTSWEKDDPERQPDDIAVHLNTDGSYSAMVYPGEYDIQLVDNRGPWVNDTTRISFSINSDKEVNVPVRPYYTIENANITWSPQAEGANTHGQITATFQVAQQEPGAPNVEVVGLYVSTTTFVDRSRRETSLLVQTNPPPPDGQSSNNPHERTRAQVLTELTNNQPITITLRLPDSILLTRSPEPRTTVYARVGVKTQGVTELAYSPVQAISIAAP